MYIGLQPGPHGLDTKEKRKCIHHDLSSKCYKIYVAIYTVRMLYRGSYFHFNHSRSNQGLKKYVTEGKVEKEISSESLLARGCVSWL